MKLKRPLFYLFLFAFVFAGSSLTCKAKTEVINLSSDQDPAGTSQGKLIFAVDLIRHGDRTPLMEIPTVSYTWQEGLEQLTPTGISQEFALGTTLKDRYISQSHLLPDHYTPGTLYVRSTGLDRTIMSANSALTGLYFEAGPLSVMGRPVIPAHNCSRAQEDLLFPDNNLTFNFDNLFQKVIVPLPQWQAKEQLLKPNFAAWSQATGVPINHLYDLKNLGDTLFIYKSNGAPMPSLLNSSDVATIIEAGLWATCTVFQNKIIGQVAAANLLQEMTSSFQTAVQQPNQPLHYRLYCAHDSTLLVLLTALGATNPLTTIPSYASDLNLELFDNGNGHYTVQVMLNGQPVILNCSQKNSCTLEQLQTLSQEASKQLKKVQTSQKIAL
jgi:acid phosphatase